MRREQLDIEAVVIDLRQVLETELQSFGRAASTVTHGAVCVASWPQSLNGCGTCL